MNTVNLLKKLSLASLCATVFWTPVANAATIYDPSAEFSPTSNPSSPWSYGYSLTQGGSMILHQENFNINGVDTWRTNIAGSSTPLVGNNPTSNPVSAITWVLDPGTISLHPGPNNERALLRFTAPTTGIYQILGSFSGSDIYGTTTDVHLLTNGVSIFDGLVNGFSVSSTQLFDNTVKLNNGDFLDFAVGYGYNNNYYNDTTQLSARIIAVTTSTPEPATIISLLGLGTLGMTVLKRKKTT